MSSSISSLIENKSVNRYPKIIIHSQTKIINMITEQLSSLISDYDVANLIAEKYVFLRIRDNINLSRNYHYDRLICKLNDRIPTIIQNPSVLISSRIDHFGTSTCGPHSNCRMKHSQFKSTLRYLHSKRGFHQHYWIPSLSVSDIPIIRDRNITLKEKLNDLKKIGESIITCHQFITFDWLADSETYI